MTRKINLKSALHAVIFILTMATVTPDPRALAGTFIGNGGSAQDLDLDVTLSIINKGANRIDANSETLCTCSDRWVNNPLCKVLDQLSEEERRSCKEILVKHSKDLMELSRRNTDVKFAWTDTPMSVRSKSLGQRMVDAVTNSSDRKITINRQRFFEMRIMFRVALISHELLHMTKINGKNPDDEGAATPFKNGRSMLDALGAALAIESFENKVIADDELVDLETISRSKRMNWLYLDLIGVSHPSRTSKRLLRESRSGGYSLSYAWRPGQLGFHLITENTGYAGSAKTSSGVKHNINVREDVHLTGMGVNYRINPVSFYMSGWNETHLVLGLSALAGSADYVASSTGNEKRDSGSATAIKGSFKALMALRNGFWVGAGVDFRHVSYQYKALKINSTENQTILTLGGAYGF
jgi:hypothetical protein